MTTMLAIVRTAVSASHAAEAGASRVALLTNGRMEPTAPEEERGSGARLGLMLEEGADAVEVVRAAFTAGAGLIWLPFASLRSAAVQAAIDCGLKVVGLIGTAQTPDETLFAEAAALGLEGLHVGEVPFTAHRLLERRPMAELAAWVAGCQAHGLAVGFSGALEAADVPRLLALKPDELGSDLALRDGDGRLDPVLVRAMLDLMTASETDATSSMPIRAEALDRIFVRDWTVAMSIGAYAHERGKPQRVRCSVEAEIRRSPVAGAGMASIVSYDLITDAIARLAADHVDLVETLAERLAATVLAHPRVASVDITVEKLDVGPGSVGCRILRTN